jgi:hypothetical protein
MPTKIVLKGGVVSPSFAFHRLPENSAYVNDFSGSHALRGNQKSSLKNHHRHSRECGNPLACEVPWIPAFAGMTHSHRDGGNEETCGNKKKTVIICVF